MKKGVRNKGKRFLLLFIPSHFSLHLHGWNLWGTPKSGRTGRVLRTPQLHRKRRAAILPARLPFLAQRFTESPSSVAPTAMARSSRSIRTEAGSNFSYAFSGGDGGWPLGSLTLLGSTLYGTTSFGGSYDGGTIFQINTDGSGFQLLHSFDSQSDGDAPCGSLTLSGSTLYGMTSSGGPYAFGTIFQINTDGSGFQLRHSFGSQSDGATPCGSLTLSGSTLYGMTPAKAAPISLERSSKSIRTEAGSNFCIASIACS